MWVTEWCGLGMTFGEASYRAISQWSIRCWNGCCDTCPSWRNERILLVIWWKWTFHRTSWWTHKFPSSMNRCMHLSVSVRTLNMYCSAASPMIGWTFDIQAKGTETWYIKLYKNLASYLFTVFIFLDWWHWFRVVQTAYFLFQVGTH